MHNEAVLVKAAFGAGASGFVTKSSEPSAVVHAIRSVARAERAMSDDIAHILAEDSLSPRGSALDQLGEREIEILRYLPAAPPPSRSRRISISASRRCRTITT